MPPTSVAVQQRSLLFSLPRCNDFDPPSAPFRPPPSSSKSSSLTSGEPRPASRRRIAEYVRTRWAISISRERGKREGGPPFSSGASVPRSIAGWLVPPRVGEVSACTSRLSCHGEELCSENGKIGGPGGQGGFELEAFSLVWKRQIFLNEISLCRRIHIVCGLYRIEDDLWSWRVGGGGRRARVALGGMEAIIIFYLKIFFRYDEVYISLVVYYIEDGFWNGGRGARAGGVLVCMETTGVFFIFNEEEYSSFVVHCILKMVFKV